MGETNSSLLCEMDTRRWWGVIEGQRLQDLLCFLNNDVRFNTFYSEY